jgi:hypothetical protein
VVNGGFSSSISMRTATYLSETTPWRRKGLYKSGEPRLRQCLFFVVFLSIVQVLTFPALIPEERRIDWTFSGIPGGIPVYPAKISATAAPFNADGTGGVDSTAAINSALAACPPGAAVLLPPGTYRVAGTLRLKPRTALRGEGPTTVIQFGDAGEIVLETTSTRSAALDLIGGFTKGSASLTLSTASDIAIGEPILIDQLNDSSFVDRDGTQGGGYLSRNAGSRVLQFIHSVTARNGNVLTIEPPMPFTLSPTMLPQVYRFIDVASVMEFAGVENLKIVNSGERDGTDGYAIQLRLTKYCWVKDVEIQDVCEAGIYILRGYRNEIRGCDIHHAALNNFTSGRAYGVSLWWGSSYNLIEDNICYYLRHSFVIEGGGAGNVFGYNFSDRMFDQFYPNTDYLMGDLLLHGAHPIMNLYEGNLARILYFDNVHGSGSHNTAFRNHLVGESRGENVPLMDWSLTPVGIDKNHLSNNIVGNILGKRSHSPGVYESPNMSVNPSHYAYILGQSDRANLGVAPDWNRVRGTLLRHYNWDFNTTTNNGIRFDETGLTGDSSLPNSLYLSRKPAYFGDLPWPPFDPHAPEYAAAGIPAAYRFLYGRNPQPSTNPVLSVMPARLDFGPRVIGSTNTQTITIVNSGTGKLDGAASTSRPFQIASNAPYSLEGNGFKSLKVEYFPGSTGVHTGTIDFTGGGGATVIVNGSAWNSPYGVFMPANSGALTSPFVAMDDGAIVQGIETPAALDGGAAIYEFDLDRAGGFQVVMDVLTTGEDANSVFVNVDIQPTVADIWDCPVTGSYQSSIVTRRGQTGPEPAIWYLEKGRHQLIIRGREANCRIRYILIYQVNAPPTAPTGVRILP